MVENEKNSLSIRAKADGIEISSSGKSAHQISDALFTLLSPLTNSLGYIGDRLQIAREESVIRAAKKAVERLKNEGLTTGDVTPKILVPWLEGVSLELEDDETLHDLWAGLLVRAVKSSDAANISYCEVLKKLGTEEAKLLNWFATDTAPFYSKKFYELDQIDPLSKDNPYLKNIINALERSKTIEELRKTIDSLSIQIMRQPIFYSVDGNEFDTTPFFDEHEVAISNLEHLGVIKIRRSGFKSQHHKYTIVWFSLTKFGFDLMYACLGIKVGGQHEHFSKNAAESSS